MWFLKAVAVCSGIPLGVLIVIALVIVGLLFIDFIFQILGG